MIDKILIGFVFCFLSITGFANEESLRRSVDILLVVDNSLSMRQEQANLGSRLQALVSEVRHLNWRIAVTTTDAREPCLRDVITKGERNVDKRFMAAVNAGTSGSFRERGLLRAVEGLEGACRDQSWLRRHSRLAVMFVSDEDNCSSQGQDCIDSPDAHSRFFMDYLATIRRPILSARVYGLIWHPSTPQSQCTTGYNQAFTYADLIRRTRGAWGSICERDFEETLTGLSREILEFATAEIEN